MRKALFTIGIAVAIFLMGLGGGVALYHFYLHSVIIYTSIVRSYIHSLTAHGDDNDGIESGLRFPGDCGPDTRLRSAAGWRRRQGRMAEL